MEPSGGWKNYVKNNEFLKSGKAESRDSFFVLKDNDIKKKVPWLPRLLRKYYGFPEKFLDTFTQFLSIHSTFNTLLIYIIYAKLLAFF